MGYRPVMQPARWLQIHLCLTLLHVLHTSSMTVVRSLAEEILQSFEPQGEPKLAGETGKQNT